MSRSRVVLSMLASLSLLALAGGDASAAASRAGVAICHRAGPSRVVNIVVGEAAVAQHVEGHGDQIGPCGGDDI